ncbi:MAG: hypothetical protein JXR89_09430 [Deltaproteobacteria bacterium]|nr:hypothetical protein [Deltaproteobacteria bacterium]
MRVGDLQQIMLQTDSVGKVQQQGAHGAEIEQGKLAQRFQAESREQEKKVQSMADSDTVTIRDQETRRERQEDSSPEGEPEAESQETSSEKLEQQLETTGRHIDIKA